MAGANFARRTCHPALGKGHAPDSQVRTCDLSVSTCSEREPPTGWFPFYTMTQTSCRAGDPSRGVGVLQESAGVLGELGDPSGGVTGA